MTDIEMKLYTALKIGTDYIILGRDECNIVFSSKHHDNTTNDHSECSSFTHQFEMVNDGLGDYDFMKGFIHIYTYRGKLKIMVKMGEHY